MPAAWCALLDAPSPPGFYLDSDTSAPAAQSGLFLFGCAWKKNPGSGLTLPGLCGPLVSCWAFPPDRTVTMSSYARRVSGISATQPRRNFIWRTPPRR